jgi:hypothetical protein
VKRRLERDFRNDDAKEAEAEAEEKATTFARVWILESSESLGGQIQIRGERSRKREDARVRQTWIERKLPGDEKKGLHTRQD